MNLPRIHNTEEKLYPGVYREFSQDNKNVMVDLAVDLPALQDVPVVMGPTEGGIRSNLPAQTSGSPICPCTYDLSTILLEVLQGVLNPQGEGGGEGGAGQWQEQQSRRVGRWGGGWEGRGRCVSHHIRPRACGRAFGG